MTNSLYKKLLDLYDKKNFQEIENQYFKFFSLYLRDIQSLNLFAIYHISKKNFTEAERCLSIAKELDGKNYNTLINFANIYVSKGDLYKSIPYLKAALDEKKNELYPLNLLGNVYFKTGYLLSAKKVFIQLLRLNYENKDECNLFLNLANIFYQERKYNSAILFYQKIVNYDKVLSNKNLHLLAYIGLIDCYHRLNNFEKFLYYIDKSMDQFPSTSYLYVKKNEVLRTYGKFNEALLAVNTGLHKFPKDPLLIFSKTKIFKYKEFSNEINNYELLYMSLPSNIQKAMLGFGLFKIFDDLKEYRKASKYLEDCNKIKFQHTKYSMEVENQQFDFLKINFSKNFIEKYYQHPAANISGPIFIVGMQRSGSTLLEQIIASHSRIFSSGETDLYPMCFQKFFDDFDLLSFKNSLLNLSHENLEKLGKMYLSKSSNENKDKKDVSVDKLLSNFRLIGPILLSLPNAKIIHTHRNPKDICFSIYSNFFNNQTMPWSSNQKAIINYYLHYESLMQHWINIFPNQILNVSYEKLTSDPKNEIKKVLDFCNIEWEDSCLEFYKNKNKVETESFFQVRKKIYTSSINKYDPYINYFKDFFSKLNFKSIF
jgi:tetratricopeptide (TPR) repeat protein